MSSGRQPKAKRSNRRARAAADESATARESAAPGDLIAPSIRKVDDLIRARVEDPERPLGAEWPLVPPALLPFVESFDLRDLMAAVAEHPGLYWHPLVRAEVLHLHTLLDDRVRWRKLGWECVAGEVPSQLDDVSHWLGVLLETHTMGLWTCGRVKLVADRKQPGRPARLPNPHRRAGAPEFISAARLYQDFESLRSNLEARSEELKRVPGREKAEARALFADLARQVLNLSGINWSALKEIVPTPPLRRPVGIDDLLASEVEQMQSRWSLDLDAVVEPLTATRLPEPMRNEGRPSFLAYALLGALLGVPPQQVRTRIEPYRTRHRKRQRD